MKNRLSKMGKSASWMLVLLAACGVTSSCKDEYRLDDEKPSYLNQSVYASLESQGNYKYYLRLLGDADVNPANARPLTEVLSRTGSKTVFVADDEAWDEFFKKNATLPESNPWHTATSYENLSISQKKLLIHTSMLNNAIVMENLASNLQNGSMTRGEYMRRYTDVESTDSITYLDGNSLPVNYNVGNGEKDFWWRFREENGGKGLYLVTDSSQSMMVHFTNEHLKKNNVTDEDFAIFMNEPRNTEDVHIYDAKLLEQDGVCENGYVNKTSKLITPLPNMAEMLRTNGETNIFSHMLDRWSVPFYNRGVTQAYKDIMESRGITWEDSIFTKRYFSDMSWGHGPLSWDPDGNKFADSQSSTVALKFDPSWNAYYNEKANAQYDMAAMYVPNDETLWKYFTEGGGGWQLIRTYYMKEGTPEEIPYTEPTTLDDLYHQIDQIPISTLRSLLNIIMFNSFVASVPSKMTQLRDDAQEQIFYADDIEHIKKSLLANNGVIYITDKVYGPADYTSVAAPAYISGTNLVVRWAIYNGSTSSERDFMGLNYYAYLKAMQSKFVFLLPSDKGMAYYYDPLSFNSQKSRMLKFYYKKNGNNIPISFEMYHYVTKPETDKDGNTFERGDIAQIYSMEKMSDSEISNRMKDLLESHTIVLEDKDEIDSDIDEWYIAKNYSPVKVTRENGKVVKAQGGFQLENETDGIEGRIHEKNNNKYLEVKGIQACNVNERDSMNNGTTYILDSPVIPASRSVYANLSTNPEFSSFYENCCTPDDDITKACGLVDVKNLTSVQVKAEIKKFQVFVNNNDAPDYNVQFFNNYHYTLFVPDNKAMQDAIDAGLPTWDAIREYYNEHLDEFGNLATAEDSLYLQAQITYLTNFVRYHFADNSVFVDNSNFGETDYVSSSYDNVKGLFVKLEVARNNREISVKDVNGDVSKVNDNFNILARDIVCSKNPTGQSTMNGITIDGSSFAVLHQIDGVLNHVSLVNGRHDSTWATPTEARKYLKHFAIQ